MRLRYENRRTLVTLTGSVRLRLKIRRCETMGCSRYHKPYRPELEGALALPQHECGTRCGPARLGSADRRHRDTRAGSYGSGIGSSEPEALEELATPS